MGRKWPMAALTLCTAAALVGTVITGGASGKQADPAEPVRAIPLSAVVTADPALGGETDEALTLDKLHLMGFADVTAEMACRDAVSYVSYYGIMEGVGQGQFDPEGFVTRAAVVTVLHRMSGGEPPELVEYCPDVKAEDWFAPAVAWAVGNGIVTGRADGSFAPHDLVTRAELAAILYRCAEHLGYATQNSGRLVGYRDGDKVAEYAVEPLAWALGNGLYSGLVTNTIYPDLRLARGQLAQVLTAFQSHGTGDTLARQIVVEAAAQTGGSASRDRHADLQAVVDATAQKYGAVGLQAAVIEDGVVTDTYAYGWATRAQYALVDENGKTVSWEGGDPMTAEHKMRVASISKVAIGAAAMMLEQDGIVDLDASIGDYWGCKVQNPYYPNKPVTIRSLLTHTSSIFLAGDDVSRKYSSVYARLSGGTGFSRVEPGSIYAWGYNNYGFGVLGMTLELAAGKVMDDILDEYFFDLMGVDAAFESGSIQDTDRLATLYNHGGSVARSVSTQKGLTLNPTPGATGQFFAGGLTISAADLGKLVATWAGDGLYEGLRVMPERAVELMEERSSIPVSDGFYQCMPLRYRTDIYGREALYYHTGSAYGVYNCMSYDPATGDGVVVLTTGASATKDGNGIYAVCGEISRAIYDAIQ